MSAEKEYSIFQVGLNLAIACFISGLIIAGVYYVTAPIAAKNAIVMQQRAMQNLVADADTFEEVTGEDGWFLAKKGEEIIAYVVPSESKGFGGAIKMLVAVSADGKVVDFTILKHNETPGLGSNAGDEPYRKQYMGKTIEQLVVVKDPSKKDNIQAMTGATITSRAVTVGVAKAVEEVSAFIGGK